MPLVTLTKQELSAASTHMFEAARTTGARLTAELVSGQSPAFTAFFRAANRLSLQMRQERLQAIEMAIPDDLAEPLLLALVEAGDFAVPFAEAARSSASKLAQAMGVKASSEVQPATTPLGDANKTAIAAVATPDAFEVLLADDMELEPVEVTQEQRTGELLAAHALLVTIDQHGNPTDPDEALFEGLNAAIQADQDAAIIAAAEGREHFAAVREPIYRPDVDLAPALLEGPPAEEGGQAVQTQPRWLPIFELPAYLGRVVPGMDDAEGQRRAGQAVRALGSSIFAAMPCYRTMRERCVAAGRDPLGEVQVLACINGQPHSQDEMDAMVGWVRQHGRMIDAGQIEFRNVFRGYRPNVILAVSERDSFLLVEESRAQGAPWDATYVYSWEGGRRVYDEDPTLARPLQRLDGPIIQRAQPALAAPQAAPLGLPAPAAAQPIPEPAAVAGRVRGRGGIRRAPAALPGAAAQAQPVIATTPARPAPPRMGNVMQILRADGFSTVGTDRGPALQKEMPDGRIAQVMGEGKSLVLAHRFSVAMLGANGSILAESVVDSPQDALAWLADQPLPTRRM